MNPMTMQQQHANWEQVQLGRKSEQVRKADETSKHEMGQSTAWIEWTCSRTGSKYSLVNWERVQLGAGSDCS